MGHWKREAVKLLIKLYQQNVFLYNPKHRDYYNRKKRDKVMQEMCQEINKLDPGKVLHDIKMKLKTVRSQYAAEKLHMVKAKQKSGPNIICEPALWCYEDLTFLDKYMNMKGESSQDAKKENPDLRQKWVNACGLTEKDDVSRVLICSTHFTSTVIRKIPTSSGIAKSHLDHGAVPTIAVPNPPAEKPPVVESSMKLLLRTGVNTFQFAPKRFVIKDGIIEERSASQNVTPEINNLSAGPESIFTNENMKIKTENVESLDTNEIIEIQATSENGNFNDSGPNEDSFSSPTKKRRFFEPRYINEITVDDVSTPKKAQRVINLMKRTDEKKTKKIKIYQMKVRRLTRRIAALKQKTPHLSNKDWTSEESVDSLMERPEYTEWNHTDHLYECRSPEEVRNETEKKVVPNKATDPLCDDNHENSEIQNFDTVSNTSENSQIHEIACDIFGNFVASEMKQILNKNIYTKTKWKIQKAIMEGLEEQMQNE